MKIGVITFSLILAVTSSQATASCFKQYTYCFLPVVNEWGKTDNCSLAVPFMNCMTNVTEDCYPEYVTYMENYQSLTLDVCSTDPSKKEEWKKAEECAVKNLTNFRRCQENQPDNECKALGEFITCITSSTQDICGEFAAGVVKRVMFPFTQLAEECKKNIIVEDCLLNNTHSFLSCKLEGEFNKVGDICSSVDGLTQCFVQKSIEVCGEEAGKLVRPYTDDIVFAMDICKKLDFISGETVPQCDKELLKCQVKVLNADEFMCKDASDYVGCMHDAVKICEVDKKPLYLIALEKYRSKFPDYCNKESTFNKNLEQKIGCINNTFGGVMGPCYDKLEKDKREANKDDKVGNLRAYVNFLDCLSKDFGKTCGQEAESAVNDLLSPLGQSMDESCRLLTGKRCNGAAGLIVATWLLIASLVFLLTQKNE